MKLKDNPIYIDPYRGQLTQKELAGAMRCYYWLQAIIEHYGPKQQERVTQ